MKTKNEFTADLIKHGQFDQGGFNKDKDDEPLPGMLVFWPDGTHDVYDMTYGELRKAIGFGK